MAKKKSNISLSLLFGLTFLSPVAYSLVAYEMDVVQRMYFFSVSFILFFVLIARIKSESDVQMNKILLILLVLYPFTFLTSFVNGSSSLLLLRLSEIIVP
jgi:hypothetical protein